jgi:cell division protein FtsB
MDTFIGYDPTQWKLTIIFLTLLWLGLSLWRQGRKIARVLSQLQALQSAKASSGWTAAGGQTKGKMTV